MYVPGAHTPHADAPGSGAYAPGAHVVHTADVPPPTMPPYAPAVHEVHTTEVDAAATSPYMPAVQMVQANVPLTSALYAPLRHAVQAADELEKATLP